MNTAKIQKLLEEITALVAEDILNSLSIRDARDEQELAAELAQPYVMPSPPDGCEYHNPENVPAEKVPEGWRFTLAEENDGRYTWMAKFFDPKDLNILDAITQDRDYRTYIVPSDTPFPERKPVWIDLGPDDILPCSMLRYVKRHEAGYALFGFSGITSSGDIELNTGGTLSMSELREMEINRSLPLKGKWDAESWEACRKEAV